MTVQELVNELSKYPKDSEVIATQVFTVKQPDIVDLIPITKVNKSVGNMISIFEFMWGALKCLLG